MNRLFVIVCFLLLPFVGKAQTGDFETAAEAVANMGVGWNLGNTLDSHTNYDGTDIRRMEMAWSQYLTHEKVMRMMKEAGFKSIRVPVTWYRFMDSAGKVDPAWMARVHEVVDYVINQGMYCILNVHHDTGAHNTSWIVASMENYNQTKERYEYLWRQIAEEFKDYGQLLLFEGYNEMLDPYWSWNYASYNTENRYDETVAQSAYDAVNAYAQSFVNAVRSTGGNNLKRNLICSIYAASEGTAGNWNEHLQDPAKKLVMPTEPEGALPNHQLVEMHYYRDLDNMTEAKNRVNALMENLKTYIVKRLGVPVVIGEWGPRTNDQTEAYDTRKEKLVEFARYFVEKTKEYGYAPLYWRGLSEKIARLWPAFDQPEVAEAILKGYYGDDYQPKLPTYDDYVYDHSEVNWMNQYAWIYLNMDRTLDINEYKGVRIELKEKPGRNTLQLRVHRELVSGAERMDANKTNLSENETVTTFLFDKDPQWGNVKNIELHRISYGDEVVANIGRCVLLREDGTEEELTITRRHNAHIMDLVAYPKFFLDETATQVPEAATAVGAVVNRNLKAGEWSTLCLPFPVSAEQVRKAFGEDAKLADFTGYDVVKEGDDITEIKVNFETATEIPANHPCLLKVSSDISQFIVNGVNVTPSDAPVVNVGTSDHPKSLVGTYVAQTVVPANCLFLSGNKFWYSVGKTKMKAFRAYFDFADVLSSVGDAGAKICFMVDDDETSGIDHTILLPNGNLSPIWQGVSGYTLDGRRLDYPTTKGLYLHNGKKVWKK